MVHSSVSLLVSVVATVGEGPGHVCAPSIIYVSSVHGLLLVSALATVGEGSGHFISFFMQRVGEGSGHVAILAVQCHLGRAPDIY